MNGKKNFPPGMIPPGALSAGRGPGQKPQGKFEKMQASLLFCNRCQRPMPVRERLLLVLPDGELFEYRCTRCGNSVGERTEKNVKPSKIII